MSLCFLMNKVVSIGGFFNVAMHFSVSYFGNFSISVKKKIHSVRDFDLKCFISLMISEDGTTLSFKFQTKGCSMRLITNFFSAGCG